MSEHFSTENFVSKIGINKKYSWTLLIFHHDGFVRSVNGTLKLINNTGEGFSSSWNHASMINLYSNYYNH